MRASLRIGRIFGIPIHLHFTFLIALPLFMYYFSELDSRLLDIPLGFGGMEVGWETRFIFGTIAAIVFFATVLAHELAHSYVAIRYGVQIKSITLMLFGGIASMEEIPKQPRQELTMAFAGPFASLSMGTISFLAMLVMGLFDSSSSIVEGMTILFGIMAFYNVILAAFNLLPAFPMDGGRMLRSYLATRMSHLEATRKAAKTGRAIAIAMGITGILLPGMILLLLIAIFVYFGAREEEEATVISDSLEGLRVEQLMTPDVQTVHPNISVQELLDTMLATRRMGFPVTVDGTIIGIVTLSDAQKVPKDQVLFRRVGEIMTKDVVNVPPSMPAIDALKIMSERRIGRLLVLKDGKLVGIVTKKDFLRAVDVMLARSKGTAWGYYDPGGRPPPPPPPSPPAASS